MPSAAFERFVDSFGVTTHKSFEDYDIDALFQVEPGEQAQVEALLIERLRTTDDPRAARALRYISSKAAAPALREAVRTQHGSARVEAVISLRQITGEDVGREAILEELRSHSREVRLAVVRALPALDKATASPALFAALDDADKLVRATATQALYQLHELVQWAMVPARGLNLLALRLQSAYAAVREPAKEELRAVIAGREAGKSAAELGIPLERAAKSPAALRFIESFASPAGQPPWANDYDLEALAELTGKEADWARYVMYDNLEEGDFRAARALAATGDAGALTVLREARETATGRAAEEIAAAVERLSG